MKNDLYLKILKALSKSGVNKALDISKILEKQYLEPQTDHVLDPHAREKRITAFLEGMKNAQHLTSYSIITPNDNSKKWYKHLDITAWISPDGYAYYKKQTPSWWQLWGFWITCIGVVIAAIAGWFTYIEVFNKNNIKPETKQLLHNKLPPKDRSSQSPIKVTPTALPADSFRKH